MSNDAPYIMWHVDDYQGDTGHLSCIEHGAYTQILWACWKRGGSLPESHLQPLVKLTPKAWAKVRERLAEFFEVDDGIWTHRRIVNDIGRVEESRAAASKAGKASAKARRAKAEKPAKAERPLDKNATPVERPLNDRSTTVQQKRTESATPVERPLNHVDVDVDVDVDNRPHPSDENDAGARGRAATVLALVDQPKVQGLNTQIAERSAKRRAIALPDGITLEAFEDYLDVRASKNKPVPLAAMQATVDEIMVAAKVSGEPPGTVLRMMTAKGWIGVRPEWIERSTQRSASDPPPDETPRDRANRAARARGLPTVEESRAMREAIEGDSSMLPPEPLKALS